MSKTSTSNKQGSDEARKITAADFERARFRVGRRDVNRGDWQAAVREKLGKKRITMCIDDDVLAAFKAKAGERGYQTLINQTLRETLAQEDLETMLHRVVREELART